MEKCQKNETKKENIKENDKTAILSEKQNLIQSIKSVKNINQIFLFLINTKKLDLIIYNNKIKNRLKIDIEYYKKISGRYKIGENNG